jgi:hypothetical protein
VADGQIRDVASGITAQFGPALTFNALNPREGPTADFETRLERELAKGRITIAPEDCDWINGLLITVIGRKRILKLMKESGHAIPAVNDPFLSTRKLFMLKADPKLAEQWRSGDPTLQIGALNEMAARANPSLDQINAAYANGPKAIKIEWFASAADLANLFAYMRRTADPRAFDILAINPLATDAIKANWRSIGSKSGSEPWGDEPYLVPHRQGRKRLVAGSRLEQPRRGSGRRQARRASPAHSPPTSLIRKAQPSCAAQAARLPHAAISVSQENP